MKFEAARHPLANADTGIARAHVKRALCAAFRLFAKHGLNEGVAGHLTARDPSRPDCFWVNPFGAPYALMLPERLSLMRHDGALTEGGAVNAAAFAIHAAIHKTRPEVMCVAHGHPLHGKAWSALAELLEPLDQDVCALHGDHVVYSSSTGLVVDESEGAGIAAALGSRKAIILPNHGLLSVGRSVEEAVWWFLLMERSCQVQLMVRAAGGARTKIPDAEARAIAAQIGTPEFGWFQAQPIFEEIYAANPELAG